jgi:LmbE family N-acetylglucosaminyl deacetylase
MMPSIFTKRRALKILCLGAHSDDIEIGCGGTVLRFLEEFPGSQVHWVVFGAGNPERASEATRSARAFLHKAGKRTIIVKGFRDGYLPYTGGEVKDFFEQLKGEVTPDLILTHYRKDLHQDHRLVCDLTWNTWRDHLIWEYEIPKYDGDLGTPNIYVSLNKEICRRKIAYAKRYFATQRPKHWFTQDVFEAILRLRGIEAAGPHPFAEAFYGRKILI